jgi:hypothetical protein
MGSDRRAQPVASSRSHASSSPQLPHPDAGDDCHAGDSDQSVRVSCDRERLVFAEPVRLHPGRLTLPRRARRALDAVAQLLENRQDILLTRIEVTCPPNADGVSGRRAEILATQRRAEMIFKYLWQRRGVWAERLEALGMGCDPTVPTGTCRVSFRVVQWARQARRPP